MIQLKLKPVAGFVEFVGESIGPVADAEVN